MKSEAKAAQFLEYARKAGWQGDLTPGVDGADEAIVDVRRGEERISLSWRDGKWMGLFDSSLCWYELAGQRRLVRNASEARKYASGQPDYSRRARRARPVAAGSAIEPEEIVRNLPWDDDADDKVILKACYGRVLVWRNSLNGKVEEEMVIEAYTDRHGRYHPGNFNAAIYRISQSSAGRKAINFVGKFGYRAVGLDALLVVR